jgi:hypothetical protein
MKTANSQRDAVIEKALESYQNGTFFKRLYTQVGCRTESQDPSGFKILEAYLNEQIVPQLDRLGFSSLLIANPGKERHPFLDSRAH